MTWTPCCSAARLTKTSRSAWLEAAGVRDIVAKSLGSSNHANVVKATLQALASLRTSDQVLADRGKKKEKAI